MVRRSDNAKEFLKLTLLLGSYGINHRPAYSQTHEQIGKVERRHHNISRHRAVITSSCWTAVTVGSRLLINSIRLLEQLYILLVVEVVSIVSRISMFFFKHLQFSFGRNKILSLGSIQGVGHGPISLQNPRFLVLPQSFRMSNLFLILHQLE